MSSTGANVLMPAQVPESVQRRRLVSMGNVSQFVTAHAEGARLVKPETTPPSAPACPISLGVSPLTKNYLQLIFLGHSN